MFDFDSVIDRKGHDSVKWNASGSRRDGGADILPMWVADMDFAVPPAVEEAVRVRAGHPIYGYAGKPDRYFEAFRFWMGERYGVAADSRWMVFSPGIVPAIGTAIRAYTRPGDGVAIMPPVYHPFAGLIRANRRTAREAPLRILEGRYELDLDALDRAAAGAKLLLVCSPHNPVGRVWSRADLEAVAEIARRRDLVVLMDEIHADLTFAPHVHVPSLTVSEDLTGRLVSCWAPSKTFNMAGLQASCAVIPDDGLRAAFAAESEAAGFGGPNVMGNVAAEAAYRAGGPWLDELVRYLQANRDRLAAELGRRAPGLSVYPCEGTYLAWIDFRGAGLKGNVHQTLMDRAGLWLDAGSRFGTGGDGFARLNFGCPRSTLDLAIDRLAGAFGP